ncbi:hypothetical protein COCMIDRAFT_7940 [Bipolaris oryzae ATCC 44560]|uniref:Uncharacterized protein n=1 Tax=Bipolaris oryzae ATCC 44560 TaxID=930090 RepID=W6YY61_COCMI|nr:uncharacterized protein COCMIDRAFT_7940 [Bipolaris oryzae ATCC 44560]EUC42513.1 hypothetical protein COCMIDRAFT_7940 [Bipolaris oryzae ATCC 44560]
MKATATVLGLTAPHIAFDLPPGLDLEQPAISVGVPPCFLIRAGSETGTRSVSLCAPRSASASQPQKACFLKSVHLSG